MTTGIRELMPHGQRLSIEEIEAIHAQEAAWNHEYGESILRAARAAELAAGAGASAPPAVSSSDARPTPSVQASHREAQRAPRSQPASPAPRPNLAAAVDQWNAAETARLERQAQALEGDDGEEPARAQGGLGAAVEAWNLAEGGDAA